MAVISTYITDKDNDINETSIYKPASLPAIKIVQLFINNLQHNNSSIIIIYWTIETYNVKKYTRKQSVTPFEN